MLFWMLKNLVQRTSQLVGFLFVGENRRFTSVSFHSTSNKIGERKNETFFTLVETKQSTNHLNSV